MKEEVALGLPFDAQLRNKAHIFLPELINSDEAGLVVLEKNVAGNHPHFHHECKYLIDPDPSLSFQ